jgi:hypothetical protein
MRNADAETNVVALRQARLRQSVFASGPGVTFWLI